MNRALERPNDGEVEAAGVELRPWGDWGRGKTRRADRRTRRDSVVLSMQAMGSVEHRNGWIWAAGLAGSREDDREGGGAGARGFHAVVL